jgi:uncharacterized delta-60 repeat protein
VSSLASSWFRARRLRALLVVPVLVPLLALVAPGSVDAQPLNRVDPSYGANGVARLGITASDTIDHRNIVALPDGSVVFHDLQVGLIRVDATGQRVASYTANGPVPSTPISQLTADAEGRVLTISTSYDDHFVTLRRYKIDGHLDPTFGTAGVVTISTGEYLPANYGANVAVDTSGRILVTNMVPVPGAYPCQVSRLLADGSVDTSFGQNGRVPDEGRSGFCGRIFPLANGAFIIFSGGGIVTRFDSSGVPQPYGGTGNIQYQWSLAGDLAAVRSDGAIVMGGYGRVGQIDGLHLMLLTPAGVPDPSFGTGGIASITWKDLSTEPSYAFHEALSAITFDPDGAVVASGEAGEQGMGMARWRNGALDPTFGNGGRLIVREGELPSGYEFVAGSSPGHMRPGTFDAGGILHQLVWPPVGSVITDLGLTRVDVVGPSRFEATIDEQEGPDGTTANIEISGCPANDRGGNTFLVALDGHFNQLNGWLLTGSQVALQVTPTPPVQAGIYSGTIDLGFEPINDWRRADHTYSVDIKCGATGEVVSAGSFTFQPAPGFVSVGPRRLLDTRPASALGPAQGAPAAGKVFWFQVPTDDELGLPWGSTWDVVLSVTATGATAPGFVTVGTCGVPSEVSTLNVTEVGQTVANLTIVEPDEDGYVCVYTQSPTHIVVDIVGGAPYDGDYWPDEPERLLDTRAGGARPGPGVRTRVTLPYSAQLNPGRPVVLNLTATNASGPGWVTAYPCDQPVPNASNLNLERPGQTVANLTVVGMGHQMDVCFSSSVGTDLIVDLVGGWVAGSTPTAPTRLLDTRANGPQVGYTGAKPVGGQVLALQVAGRAGVPTTGVDGVILNVTATGADGPGWLTVYPCGQATPYTSNLNVVRAGQTVPVSVVTGLGTNGKVCIYTKAGTHIVADLDGWLSS